MSEDLSQKVYEQLRQARELGAVPESVAAARGAVDLADSIQDPRVSYTARLQLMEIASDAGDHDVMLMAFSWCLADADKRPDEVSQWELLWKYKWVLEHLPQYPGISRAQIETALQDFEARCKKAGFNERAPLYMRWRVETSLGDPTAAHPSQTKWKTVPRDSMADCEACEINNVVELYSMLEDHENALSAAKRILSGRLRCAEIPHLTYATLLRSCWKRGELERAEEYHQKGYRIVRSSHDFIREQALHILHLTRAKQLDRAMTLVRRHLPWALTSRNLHFQFHMFVATRVVARALAAEGKKSIRLRVPEELIPTAAKTTVSVADLLKWLDPAIAKLSGDFDRRNGNNWYSMLAERGDG